MEKDKKMEEIRVLDKGKNIDINFIPMMAFCCGGLFIPFRW
ncbi:hypothetical protein ACFL1N_16265 [Thermodesulfobacteriota bacterium]